MKDDVAAGMGIVCLFLAIGAAFGAFWIWPAGTLDAPISALTLRSLLQIGAAAFLIFIAVCAVVGVWHAVLDNT
jgi:hypothetical protein